MRNTSVTLFLLKQIAMHIERTFNATPYVHPFGGLGTEIIEGKVATIRNTFCMNSALELREVSDPIYNMLIYDAKNKKAARLMAVFIVSLFA